MSGKEREQISGIIHIGSSFIAPSGSRKEKTLHTVEKKKEEEEKNQRIKKLPVNPEPDLVPTQIQEILDKIAEDEGAAQERKVQEDLEELHRLGVETAEQELGSEPPPKRNFAFKIFKAGEINSAYLANILDKTAAVTGDIHPLNFGDPKQSTFNYMSLTSAAKSRSVQFDPFNQAKLPDSWFSSEEAVPLPVEENRDKGEGEKVGDVHAEREAGGKKEETLEEQVARAMERRDTLEQYWSFVKENPYDFTGWGHLLEHVETMRDINITRGVYNAFLPLYPYCFAYWKRYSDLERKSGNDQRAVEVLERGLEAIPFSNELWLSLVGLTLEIYNGNAGQEEYVRWRYEQAISTAGHLFTADSLWESYISWEVKANRLDKATTLYRRAVKVPTRLYNKHFDNFIAHIREYHPVDILGQKEYEKRREEACKRIGMTYRETFHFPRDDKDPSQLKRKMDKPESKLIAAMKEKLVADVLGSHREAEKEVDVVWEFEDKIRRPYFHVKPLDKRQLKNWHTYLDFEISRGQYSKIITLFERCLVACANYEELWAKYANVVEKWIGRNPAKEERTKIKEEKIDDKPAENVIQSGKKNVRSEDPKEVDATRITELELEKQKGEAENGKEETLEVVDLTAENQTQEDAGDSAMPSVVSTNEETPINGVSLKPAPDAPPFVGVPDLTNQGPADDGRCAQEQSSTNHVSGPEEEDLDKFEVTAESVRNVYRRGCLIHCPKKPRIRLLWSLFEEEQGNYDWSRNLIEQVVEQYPSLLEARCQLIEMELRLKNHERVVQLYEYHLTHAWSVSKMMGSWLSMKYARYQFKVRQNPEKALTVLRGALKKDRSNPSLYHNLVDLCYQKQPTDAKGVRAAFTLALLSKDMKVTDKVKFAKKKLEFARDFGDVRSYRESMEQLVFYVNLAEKNTVEVPELTTVATGGKVIANAPTLCSSCGGSVAASVPSGDTATAPPAQQMDSGMMQYFQWLQDWYRQFYGEGAMQSGNAFHPPTLPNYGTYGYGSTDFTQLPLYQQEQLHQAEAQAAEATEAGKPNYSEVAPTESINMSIPLHLKKDPNFQEWEIGKFNKYAELEAQGWPKDHTTVIHVTIHDPMPIPPQKPLPPKRKKRWYGPRHRPVDFPEKFKLRMIDQGAICDVQYLDLAGVDRIYPTGPVTSRTEGPERALYHDDGPQPLFPWDPLRYKWFNPDVFRQRRSRWERKSESGEDNADSGSGEDERSIKVDDKTGDRSQVAAVGGVSDTERGSEIEVIVTKHATVAAESRKRRSSDLDARADVLSKLPKTAGRPRPGLGLLPTPKLHPQQNLSIPGRPPEGFSHLMSTLVEARKAGYSVNDVQNLPQLPRPLFPAMANCAADALSLPLCDELAQNVSSVSYSPCVNTPDWFLSNGGELVLSQSPEGFSTMRFVPRFLTQKGMHLVYGSMRKSQRWIQRNTHLVSWLGPCDYDSPSLKLSRCENWPVPVCDVIYKLIGDTSRQWNSCMTQLFRSGYDWLPWCDVPLESAGKGPSVAIVLLGAMRIIELQKRHGRKDFMRFPLFPGSSLILEGTTLSEWTWQVPRDSASAGRDSHQEYKSHCLR